MKSFFRRTSNTDLSLRWAHMSEGTFSDVAFHMMEPVADSEGFRGVQLNPL